MGKGMINAERRPGERQAIENQSVAIHLKAVAGAIKRHTPGIGCDALPFGFNSTRAGILPVGGGIKATMHAEGGLKLRPVEDTVGKPHASHGVGRDHATMVRVCDIKSTQHFRFGIRNAIAVGIAHQPVARLFANQRSIFREGNSVQRIESARESRAFVGPAVAVGILKHNDFILLGLPRNRVWKARHGHHPKPSARIESDLHRGAQFGKLFL